MITLADTQVGDLSSLVQYGAVGLLAVLALLAVRVLFSRLVKTLEAESKRADRLEAELARLNATIQDKHMVTMSQATQAITEALIAVREHRRR